MAYNFSINSGYKIALDELKTQIKAVQDDTPTAIFTDKNIFDYTPNMATKWSQANFPLCILKVQSEEMKSNYNQNSDIIIKMYHLFNSNDVNFYNSLNQIISTFRKEFAVTHFNRFRIEEIERDDLPNELGSNFNKLNPFYSVSYTIRYNSVKY